MNEIQEDGKTTSHFQQKKAISYKSIRSMKVQYGDSI
jgi:hypothetical protein